MRPGGGATPSRYKSEGATTLYAIRRTYVEKGKPRDSYRPNVYIRQPRLEPIVLRTSRRVGANPRPHPNINYDYTRRLTEVAPRPLRPLKAIGQRTLAARRRQRIGIVAAATSRPTVGDLAGDEAVLPTVKTK